MRVVLDTNILVSALLIQSSVPGKIYAAWIDGSFTLLFSKEQRIELRHTLCKPKIAGRLRPHEVGRLINNLDRLADMLGPLPRVVRSSDPNDDFLLSMAEVGRADFLVTGDKGGLLTLVRHKGTRILSASAFAKLFK